MAAKKKEPKEVKEDLPDLSRNAELLLKSGTQTVRLHGRLMVDGKPDGIQLHGHGHQFVSISDDLLILQRYSPDPQADKQLYLDNGWRE